VPALSRHNRVMNEFAIVFDDRARRWLDEHPNRDALVIAYSDTRCCGGAHIRDLRLRRSRRGDARSALVEIGAVDGRRILLDSRIMPRMPRNIPVTLGGLGPLQALHLDFSGDQWARLLYDA
jgi:hypothetical protein